MTPDRVTYEQVRIAIASVPIPPSDNFLKYYKIPGSDELAIARRHDGQYQLLIFGEQIQTDSKLIAQHLEFSSWHDETSNQPITANSLFLPDEEHFEVVASVLAVEFSGQDSDLSSTKKFQQVEPLLEPFLRRKMLSEIEVVGLIGELIFLKRILESTTTDDYFRVLNCWHGHEQAARDFAFGEVSVEVKTTRSPESHHQINNPTQVEVACDCDGAPTEKLFLASLGLAKANEGSAATTISLSEIYIRIVEILRQAKHDGEELVREFSSNVAAYGVTTHRSFIFDEMSSTTEAKERWNLMFTRIYDMSDINLSLPRQAQLAEFRHAKTSSFSYMMELPRRLTGDINPNHSLDDFIDQLTNDPEALKS